MINKVFRDDEFDGEKFSLPTIRSLENTWIMRWWTVRGFKWFMKAKEGSSRMDLRSSNLKVWMDFKNFRKIVKIKN